MKQSLFSQYKEAIANFTDVKDRDNLLVKDCSGQRIYYAPFDYVNPKAKLFVIGITSGEQQMENMPKIKIGIVAIVSPRICAPRSVRNCVASCRIPKGRVNRLSLEKGEVDVDGRIDSFAYSDKEEPAKKAASFLGRMFQ